MKTERRMMVTDLEFREDSGAVTLSGYASTFNEPYSMGWYEETVDAAAFKRTLGRNPDVRLLINHDGLPLARTTSGTLRLSSDQRGLKVEADLDPTDPDTARLLPKMRRGDLNQMSFGFRTIADEWSDNNSKRSLRELDLNNGDVSVVTYPANPMTTAAVRGVEGAQAEALRSALADLEKRAASQEDIAAVLQRALGYFAAIDSIVDDAQAEVADTLGVPNPDDQQDALEAKSDGTEVEFTIKGVDPGAAEALRAISEAAWNGSESRFTPEQWRASCVLHKADTLNKSDHGFPIREPDGTLNRAAVHNAAARINQAKATPEQIASAKAALRGAYKTLGEDAPDSIRSVEDDVERRKAQAEYETRLRRLRAA